MRIQDGAVFSRSTVKREFRKVYFIAFEGLTELEYFSGVRNGRNFVGIGGMIDLQLVERFAQNMGDSDPVN